MKNVLNKLRSSIVLEKVNPTTFTAGTIDKAIVYELGNVFKEMNGERFQVSDISDEVMLLEIVKRAVASKFLASNSISNMEIRLIEFNIFDSIESVVMSKNVVNGVKEVLIG